MKINAAIAGLGTLVLSFLAAIDPSVSWRDAVLISIGIWAMFCGQLVTQILLREIEREANLAAPLANKENPRLKDNRNNL